MPSINMIAARRSEKKRLETNVRRLLAVIVAEIVVGVLLGSVFTIKILNTRARIADLNVDLARLQPTVTKIENYEKLTAKLGPKLDVLSDAKTQTLRWYNLMGEMTEALPPETWLTRIATVSKTQTQEETGTAPAGIAVNFNGMSVNQNKVGDAMLNLNSYPDFERVDLNFTQKAAVGKLQTIEFEIAVLLKSDQEKEGAKNDAGKS